VVRRSADYGATWTAPAPLHALADGLQPRTATDGAGTWVAAWIDGSPVGVKFSRSTDDGATSAGAVADFLRSATGPGYKYKESFGITRAKVKRGDDDNAKALIKGRGDPLPDLVLPLPLPVTAVLTNSDAAACWTSTFDGLGVKNNGPGLFKAKAP
jgi:hypothetical protein